MNESNVGLGLRLKAGAALAYATLRHPSRSSRIVVYPDHSGVRIEYEESHPIRFAFPPSGKRVKQQVDDG